jgi:hypothetical protein
MARGIRPFRGSTSNLYFAPQGQKILSSMTPLRFNQKSGFKEEIKRGNRCEVNGGETQADVLFLRC